MNIEIERERESFRTYAYTHKGTDFRKRKTEPSTVPIHVVEAKKNRRDRERKIEGDRKGKRERKER